MWRTGMLLKFQSKGSGMDKNGQFGAFLEALKQGPFWATLVTNGSQLSFFFL
jgi:hypothetical protein